MKINLVYDFKSINGFMLNSLDSYFFKNFFNLSFIFNKSNIDLVNKNEEIEIHTGELNIKYFDTNKVEISEVENLLKTTNGVFIYPIATNGKNKLSLGIDSRYRQSSIVNLISEKAKKLLKKYNKFKVLIYFGLEHEMPFDYFKKIYIDLQNNNINPKKIWIVSNNYKNIDNNLKFLKRFGISEDKQLNFLIYYEQLHSKANELVDDTLKKLFIDEKSAFDFKTNKCLMLNRRLHWHRKIFLSLIANDNLFDNNLISFDLPYNEDKIDDNFIESIEYDNYLQVDLFYKKNDYSTQSFSKFDKNKIINGYNRLQKIKYNKLDVSNFESIDGRYLELDNLELYKNSYFSLVTETEFFEKWSSYTTEKVLKPIQQLHPFIVLGRPHTLKYLKSYGFKTFSDFWDESYDEEIINSKRIFKVYNLFQELCNKTDNEWYELINSMKDILIYNRNVLKKYSYKNDDLVIENFKKYLSNEHIKENPKLLQTP